jgi:hypothetical protein
MDFLFVSLVAGNGDVVGARFHGQRSIEDYSPNYLALDPMDYTDMVESVKAKATTMAYANESLCKWAVSMTLAEGKKTVQSIYEILFSFAELLLAAKRLDWRYLKNELSLEELRDKYMVIRYAVRPLMIDAENALKAVGADFKDTRRTVRGGSDDRVVTSDLASSYFSAEGVDGQFQRTSAYLVEARAGVLCDVMPDSFNNIGIDQLPQTVLEVIPFSFIAGWFFNIADIVSSWSPVAGVNELASWVTVKTTLKQDVTLLSCSPRTPPAVYGEFTWSGTKTLITTTTQRFPSPRRDIWPRLDVNLDSLKLLDLGIILQGILSGNIRSLSKKMF